VNIELRSEATITGDAIRFRQIARWSAADDAVMGQTGDLILARFERNATSRIVDAELVRATLEGAGVNLGNINLGGALACEVKRNDPATAEQRAPAPVTFPATRPATESPTARSTPVETRNPRTLRELLLAELSDRFALPQEVLQVRFNVKDEPITNLSEPQFTFQIEPRRQKNLGDISWDVTMTSPAGAQKAAITARVQAWQNILYAARPLATKQAFRDEDLVEKRVLLDRLPEEIPLTRERVVGQQANRDIAVGTPLTARMIEPVMLARIGQLIFVTVEHGGITLTWVAEARESGSYGQTVRVKKPTTREEFNVILTGPERGRLVGGSAPGR
jgi:flagella basal body P-ring formation protein FlgA